MAADEEYFPEVLQAPLRRLRMIPGIRVRCLTSGFQSPVGHLLPSPLPVAPLLFSVSTGSKGMRW